VTKAILHARREGNPPFDLGLLIRLIANDLAAADTVYQLNDSDGLGPEGPYRGLQDYLKS
jgi:hypothetical protein